MNQLLQYKKGDTEVDNFAQSLGKYFILMQNMLKNIKPAAKCSPSGIIYHPDIDKQRYCQ